MRDFNEVAVFVQVVRSASFVGAARVLGLPKSTISRRIAALEARLGARLLDRTTRRIYVTEAGRAFFDRATIALDDLRDAENAVTAAQSAPTGLLRLTAPAPFANNVLVDWIETFMAAHPGIRIDAMVANAYADMLADGIDLAFRAGPLTDSSLIARRLGEVAYLLVASPAYLTRRGRPHTPDALTDHDCLMLRTQAAAGGWRFTGPSGPAEIALTPRLIASDLMFVQIMAERGQGIAYLPAFVVRRALESGTLMPVLEDWRPAGRDMFVVYPGGRILPPRVRAFLDFVLEEVGKGPSWVSR